jgi:hypothetical protein
VHLSIISPSTNSHKAEDKLYKNHQSFFSIKLKKSLGGEWVSVWGQKREKIFENTQQNSSLSLQS